MGEDMTSRVLVALLAVALAACGTSAVDVVDADGQTSPVPEAPPTTTATAGDLDGAAEDPLPVVREDTGGSTALNPPVSASDAEQRTSVTTMPHAADDGGVPEAYLAAVIADAAARAGVEASAVLVAEAYPTDWPDSSLGCPTPGMAYTQVITPGYHVVLEAAGRQFDYRMTSDGGFRLCDHSEGLYVPDPPDKSGTVPAPPPPGDS